jgi:hypothetical protein
MGWLEREAIEWLLAVLGFHLNTLGLWLLSTAHGLLIWNFNISLIVKIAN